MAGVAVEIWGAVAGLVFGALVAVFTALTLGSAIAKAKAAEGSTGRRMLLSGYWFIMPVSFAACGALLASKLFGGN